MFKRLFYIQCLCLLGICATAQTYSFSFKNVTIAKALIMVEDKTDVAIIYSPSEIPTTQVINLTVNNQSSIEAVQCILGPNYFVKQKGSILTVRYAPRSKVQATQPTDTLIIAEKIITIKDSIECDTIRQLVESVSVSAALDTFIVDSITDFQTDIAVLVGDTTALDSVEVTHSMVVAPTEAEIAEKSLQVVSPASPHRLMLSLGTGYGHGTSEQSGTVTTVFDLQYGYFFHNNWGISAGLGIDYFGNGGDKSAEERLLNFSIPVMLQMDYTFTPLVSLIGSLGVAFELPISGTYAVDSVGNRYSNSMMLNVASDIGTSFSLCHQLDLGIAIYGQCIVASVGNIYSSLNGLFPWQVGAKVSLRVKSWILNKNLR